jgi:4-amino-4-deoxychorismate lyase
VAHPIDEVPYNAPAIERGVGFFETVLLIGRRAIFWEEHLARLLSSLTRLHLPAPARLEIEQASARAVSHLPLDATEEAALRLAWVALRADLDARDSWRLDASVRDIPATSLLRRGGSHGISLPAEFTRDTPGLKSTSYLAAVLGLRYARHHGGDEGLFVAFDGSYLEGASTGLIAWNDGQPVVSPHAVLPSVTAAALVKDPARAPLTPSLLRSGAILLGSLTKATPLLSLDGEPCVLPASMMEKINTFNKEMATSAVSL